jgi:hypothetical protein
VGNEFYGRLLNETFLGIVIDIGRNGQHCTMLVVEPYADYVERLGIVQLQFPERVFDAKTGRVFSEEDDFRNANYFQPSFMPTAEMMTHRLG